MKYTLIICTILATALTLVYLKHTTTKSYIKINNKKIFVKLAETPEERANGLMNVQDLKQDHGMLFIFDSEANHNIWMKNTFIPLDILWLDKNQKIVYIEHNAQPCKIDPCEIYSAYAPSSYVIEVNGGYIKNNGITTESKVELGL